MRNFSCDYKLESLSDLTGSVSCLKHPVINLFSRKQRVISQMVCLLAEN